jgi:hypothetical protein
LRRRAVFLVLVWVLLLVLSLSFLSILLSLFINNPQGETISSLSWSGYVVSKITYAEVEVTSINASWTVPTVNASAGDDYSSVWIGIGGQLDSTLIQVGTEQDVTLGQASYYAWYELLPSYAVALDTTTISPGDAISASLNLIDSATNQWGIQLSDMTTGQSYSTTVTYNSTRSSGEWILERPTIKNKLTTLPDFGNITFTNCHLNANSMSGAISKFRFTRVKMSNSQNVQLASVSYVTDNGTSFTVSYVPISKK